MKLMNEFQPIRIWARARGILDGGDPKTQCLKLSEEVGELAKAINEGNQPEIQDALGDCVVVLVSLAYLCNTDLEQCVNSAFEEIANRSGHMQTGTFIREKPKDKALSLLNGLILATPTGELRNKLTEINILLS